MRTHGSIFSRRKLATSARCVTDANVNKTAPMHRTTMTVSFLAVPRVGRRSGGCLRTLSRLGPARRCKMTFRQKAQLALPARALRPRKDRRFGRRCFVSNATDVSGRKSIICRKSVIHRANELLRGVNTLLGSNSTAVGSVRCFVVCLHSVSSCRAMSELVRRFCPRVPHVVIRTGMYQPN